MSGRLAREPLADLRNSLRAFFDRYRQYTSSTGDCHHLVRTFNNFGNQILRADPLWAAELAQEAATWDPNNAHSWSLLGRALDAAGDWRRAEAVSWHARRRFPHDPTLHNQLGDALARRGKTGEALAVLDDALRFFPDDVVTHNSKVYALARGERRNDALDVCNEMVRRFPGKPAGYLSKADMLMQLERLEEAAEALKKARAIDPLDPELIKKERKLQRFQNGQGSASSPTPPPSGRDGFPETLAGITGRDFSHAPSLGRATAFRRAGNHQAAREHLESVTHPDEKRSEEGLQIWQESGVGEAAAYFEQQSESRPGSCALTLHYSRACRRSNRHPVDWDFLQSRFPWLESVILTEKNGGTVPRYLDPGNEDNPTNTHEARKRHWFRTAVERDRNLLDPAEEELIAASSTA